jgi:tRNA-Thr(GGU) m(6)t(6)A37 methyltransferase TsaA
MTDDDIRPGEKAVAIPIPDGPQLYVIGRIRTPWTDRRDCPRQGSPDGPECRIEVFEPWREALAGLDRFSAVEVLYWLDRSRRDLVLQSPRHDGETRGTFALRSPVRPNPIGTVMARLVRMEPGAVVVRGLDCLDGTPLIDLKPDRCQYSPLAPAKPGGPAA